MESLSDFLCIFFAVPSQIAVDTTIKLYIENPDDNLRADLDTQNPGLKAIFFEAQKLNYNLYQCTPQFQATKSFTRSQLKTCTTGVQPV